MHTLQKSNKNGKNDAARSDHRNIIEDINLKKFETLDQYKEFQTTNISCVLVLDKQLYQLYSPKQSYDTISLQQK